MIPTLATITIAYLPNEGCIVASVAINAEQKLFRKFDTYKDAMRWAYEEGLILMPLAHGEIGRASDAREVA